MTLNDKSSDNGGLNADGPSNDEAEPKKPSVQILRAELKEARDAIDRTASQLFFSGLSAGLELGFSLFLMALMKTLLQDELPEAIVTLVVANMYSFGFLLVILGRSELFTEQTSLAVLPVLHRQASVTGLMRLWGVVYVANLIGAAAVAGLMVFAGPLLGVIDPPVFASIANHVVDHPPLAMFTSAILAGWLMGLLSWLVAAGRDTISQIVLVWLITTAIGLGQLHHCVLGTVEVLAGVFSSGGPSLGQFSEFLLWATLGNAIGGPFFVAVLKYTHARPQHGQEAI